MPGPVGDGPADGPPDHPDLSGLAAEMRAAWRAEQAAAAADAAEQFRHARSLADWFRERMHAGDRVAVTVAARTLTGRLEDVGDDFVALRRDGAGGLVEINTGAVVPVSCSVVEHATHGGT